ncbi:nuclear transport factor 2 family protein [Anaerobium acetethylicum]|uniref:Predicted SnoaL-like aldol condensation-catalyzing enzyme n=1 Tax=Anaerobium acetethylicum TaxID=1619234 RepID=A0A1D3TW83_9FIRM|nr:ester cyclase [Anaerobium acetethylicum]SCP98475.1 Predicted SnoaL-like aldol condensation-catalyzing enzyme [Anaerobium acetethylicum]
MTNKELIQNFYNEFFNMHKIEAANLYVREDYIQHNPGLTHGREALKEGFAKKFESDPTFRLEIKMMIAEDDMVAVYLKNVDPEGNTKCRVVDIYRIQDGQLAEHWDVLQPVTK